MQPLCALSLDIVFVLFQGVVHRVHLSPIVPFGVTGLAI